MWKLIAESVEGTSHRRSSQPCQDHCRAGQVRVGVETLLIVVCADGAGSAELSEVGSKLACDRFFEIAYERLSTGVGLATIGRSVLLDWYQTVHDSLVAEAVARNVAPRQLACTLLTAIVGEAHSTFAQVGDGSIVFLDNDYQSVFWPQIGEYANTTNFITQSNFESAFEFAERASRIDELAVFTDGLQRLALSFANKAVHQAFFAPIFKQLRATEDADELVAPLRNFMDSASVNERTDDDKTLVLATRVVSRGDDAV